MVGCYASKFSVRIYHQMLSVRGEPRYDTKANLQSYISYGGFYFGSRAYISREILSRCTFGVTNFLLISFFEFNWRPIPILMPFSCSLGSICIIEFHFQIKINSKNDINKKFVSPNVHRESISPEM